ncbi:MAG: sigma 54-interacting transcriptional regulator, partial [Proteobacteria bacterium]|nr:sigma 54-interacting transcriptional regulator [Pseudomonadota bacterium]
AEGEFFRVGGRELIRVDVRVIAATHQDLDKRVAAGRFRSDLLHRLDVVRLRLPPLRERAGDIGVLAARFLAHATARFNAPAKKLAPEALRLLQAHAWPGNVRELENICWRLAALAPGTSIRAADVREHLHAAPGTGEPADWTAALTAWARMALVDGQGDVHGRAKARFEQALLTAALEHTDGHRQRAAQLLGLGRNTLTRKLGGKQR